MRNACSASPRGRGASSGSEYSVVTGTASVPAPPSPFSALTHVLARGSILHRVHSKRDANDFNPGRGAPTRFAPIFAGSVPVPTLYAAHSAEAAVCETLLHDVPLAGGSLPLGNYAAYIDTSLEVQRDLRLAKLMGDGLRRLGVTPQQLTATNGDIYDRTVLWAEAAHTAGFDGLAWMSARDNTAAAYVFFGDRVAQTDLLATTEGIGPFAPGGSGFTWLSGYCARVGVELLIA